MHSYHAAEDEQCRCQSPHCSLPLSLSIVIIAVSEGYSSSKTINSGGGISRERTLVLLLFETTVLYLCKNRMSPPSSANSTLRLVPKGINTFLSVHVLSCAGYPPHIALEPYFIAVVQVPSSSYHYWMRDKKLDI